MPNITAADEDHTAFKGEQLPVGMGGFLVALNIFLAITASLGNALILIALHKVSSLHPPTKLLFRYLAATDLCVGLISQPLFAIYEMFFLTNITWKLAFYIIQVHRVSTVVLCGVSIMTSTAISVDRLLAMLLGLRYRHVVTLRRVRVVIISFWLLSSSLSVWMRFGEGINVHIFIVSIILCLLTSLFSYTKIYLRLRHHQSQLQVQPHFRQGEPPNEGETPLNIARYKKTVSSIAWVQLALLICYLPFSVYCLLTLFGGITLQMARLFLVISFLYLNSSLNPALYCWKIREVRQAVKDTIRQFNCCSPT